MATCKKCVDGWVICNACLGTGYIRFVDGERTPASEDDYWAEQHDKDLRRNRIPVPRLPPGYSAAQRCRKCFIKKGHVPHKGCNGTGEYPPPRRY